MELKKAKKRFIEIANKTGIHGDNLKQEPNMQERDELWDITRVFLKQIYILDDKRDLSKEELPERVSKQSYQREFSKDRSHRVCSKRVLKQSSQR